MPLPEDFLAILTKVASHPAFQQIAPFAILFLVPLLILLCQAHITSLFYSLSMVLENLSLILPWNWYSGHGSTSTGRKKQKKLVRTRAEQLGARRDASGMLPHLQWLHHELNGFGIQEAGLVEMTMDTTLELSTSPELIVSWIPLFKQWRH